MGTEFLATVLAVVAVALMVVGAGGMTRALGRLGRGRFQGGPAMRDVSPVPAGLDRGGQSTRRKGPPARA